MRVNTVDSLKYEGDNNDPKIPDFKFSGRAGLTIIPWEPKAASGDNVTWTGLLIASMVESR